MAVKLRIEDWVFDIDMARTMEYSAEEATGHCTCDDCLNFYAAVDGKYPELRPFLAQFGLDLEAPEQMSPVMLDRQQIDYDPSYIVYGSVLQYGTYEMAAGNARIIAEAEPDADYFWLHCYDVILPWVLEKSLKQEKTRS